MLLSVVFLSITLFPPSSDVTLPVRQVSKLSCQPRFLRNLADLLPPYLPSDLEIFLKDGIRVGSAGAFGAFISRTSPRKWTLWFSRSQASWFLWHLRHCEGSLAVRHSSSNRSPRALRLLTCFGPPTQFMVWESYVHGPSMVFIMVLPESCDSPRSLGLSYLSWLLLEIWKTCCVSRMK